MGTNPLAEVLSSEVNRNQNILPVSTWLLESSLRSKAADLFCKTSTDVLINQLNTTEPAKIVEDIVQIVDDLNPQNEEIDEIT